MCPVMPYDNTSLNATDLQVANYTRLQYSNPFFDLSRHYFPKSVKTLFKYCRVFFYQNEFISNVINKLSEYPITDFIYDGVDDPTIKQNYKELAEHHLKLKSFLIECGLDYFTFGNCIVSANMKFKRFLVCGSCKQPSQYEEFPFRWVSMKFLGEKCPKCGVMGAEATIDDRYLKNPKYFKFIRWSPENITIDYDELTGESRYFYQMNEKTRKGILEGKKDVLQRVPKIFIEAIQKNRKIELDPRNLYHFKRPTLAEEDQGWGKPLLLPAMKMLWYMQTLRRGNEAIVADHLIPMRAVYPSSSGNLDPFCLSPEAWVKTKLGWKKLGRVTKDDLLITERGEETKITAIKKMSLPADRSMYSLTMYGMPAYTHVATDTHPFKTFEDGWKEIKDLHAKDFIAYPIPPIGKSPLKTFDDFKATPEFLRLLGFYLSEGWVEKSGSLRFSFSSKETEYIDFVKSELTKITRSKICCRNRGTWVEIYCVNAPLTSFLLKTFGTGSKVKTIHTIMPMLTKKQHVELLRGIFDGDGCMYYRDRGRYPRIQLGLANRQLILEIRDVLLGMGLFSSIVEDFCYNSKKWSLRLSGYDAEKLADLLHWDHKKYYNKSDRSSSWFIKDDILYSQVVKVKKSAQKTFVALEVASPCHSYVTAGTISHNTQLNLGQWTANVQEQVLRWRRDANHLGVFPVPIGYQSLGGDAKMLMITPELQYLEESIINSLGVPVEFIKGGSTWTSSSVSLRIVENHFLTYRESITEFLNYFVVPKVKYFLGYPDVKIRLKKFKMSDDIQAKELMLQLAAQGKIPDSYLLEEFGIDPMESRSVFKADHKVQLDIQTSQMMAQAESQGKGMVIQARYQTRAQAEATEEAARMNERKFAAELVQEMQTTDQDPSDVLQKQAISLQYMDPKRQQQVLMQLQKQAPYSFGFIMQRLQLSGTMPSPEEQRQQEMQQQEAAMAEKEHEMKMQQEKIKMKHEEHKVEVGKKQLENDWEKVEIEKERAKIPAKKVEKK